MKKIIFITLLLFIFYGEVSASDVIVIENGIGDVSDLEFPDLKLVTNNVAFSKDGIYNATYYDEQDRVYITKEVHIASNEALDLGYMTSTDVASFNLSSDYIINDYLTYDDHILIVGSKKSNDEIIQTEFIQNYGFINCYKDGKLVWNKLFDEYSEIKKIIKTSTGFLALETITSNNDYTDIRLTEYNLDGSISRRKEFTGEAYEMGIDLINLNNNIYMVYYTYSKTGDLGYYLGSRVIGVSKINEFNLAAQDSIFIGNNHSTLFLDIKYCNYYENFYLLFNTNGESGEYANNGSYNGDFMVSFNKKLEDSRYISLNNNINAKSLGIVDNDVVVYSSEDYLIERYYDNHLRYKKVVRTDLKSFYKADAITFNDSTFIFTYNYSLYGIQMKGVGYNNFKKSLTSELMFKVCSDILTSLSYNDGVITIKKHHLISQVKSNKVVYNHQEFYNQTIYLDGMYMNNYSPVGYLNVFGIYNDKTIISNDNTKLIFRNNFYIPDVINLKTNEIYDLGVKLIFNGVGYLNDQEIKSGYVINEVGNYNLQIVGNNQMKVLNFKVMPLATKLTNPVVDDSSVELSVKETYLDELNLSFEKVITTKTNVSPLIFVVSISIALSLVGVVIPTTRRKL